MWTKTWMALLKVSIWYMTFNRNVRIVDMKSERDTCLAFRRPVKIP